MSYDVFLWREGEAEARVGSDLTEAFFRPPESLEAGTHHLRLDYFEDRHGAVVRFFASFDDEEPKSIPTEMLNQPDDDDTAGTLEYFPRIHALFEPALQVVHHAAVAAIQPLAPLPRPDVGRLGGGDHSRPAQLVRGESRPEQRHQA